MEELEIKEEEIIEETPETPEIPEGEMPAPPAEGEMPEGAPEEAPEEEAASQLSL